MSYTKTIWSDGDIITANKMNNIETGVEQLQTDLDSLTETVENLPTGGGDVPADYQELVDDVSQIKADLNDLTAEAGNQEITLGEIITNSYVEANGTIKKYNNWNRTDYVDISRYEYLTANISTTYAAFYNVSKSFVGQAKITANVQFVVPDTAKYIIISQTSSLMNTLSLNGDFTAGKITKISDAVDDVSDVLTEQYYIELENGSLTSDGLKSDVVSDLTYRVRFKDFIKAAPGSTILVNILTEKPIYFNVYFYAAADDTTTAVSSLGSWNDASIVKSFTMPVNAIYYKMVFSLNNGARENFVSIEHLNVVSEKIGDNIYTDVDKLYSSLRKDVSLIQSSLNIANVRIVEELTNGGYDSHGKIVYYAKEDRLIIKDYLPVTARNLTVKCGGQSSFHISIWGYSADLLSDGISLTGWQTISNSNNVSFSVPDNIAYIRFVLAAPNHTDLISTEDVEYIEITAQKGDSPAYMISDLFSKTNFNMDRIGTLTYLQAFCMYNGKYYSTNGSNIGVQASDFTSEQTVAISVGHGNSMQTGTLHQNYAYISGWDVQKIFVVNLDTLTLVEEINLPTTGYTTCAVDDVNGIAYIFQRDTYPDTEDYYNFIAYDYINDEELFRRKTGRAFAAMQACDFCEGKIVVLNGLGTVAAPNYFLMYNTNGDVIGEFFIPSISSMEPEGIVIDKDDVSMYLSVQNKSVYKIKRTS